MRAFWNRLRCRLMGHYVGCDVYGNRYYRRSAGRLGLYPHKNGRERRWVVYAGVGVAEASRIAPMWHAWLHHTDDTVPSSETRAQAPFFLRPPRPNWTGTRKAWLPQASARLNQKRPAGTGDYQAWLPTTENTRRAL
ncbi:MAG: NADH:ubiquinone oxidoreductase subunit NDUFA12 [Alphaproteobacteria bacterium GM202ARS2]|nr:NADH:ubiquinone oxidoreductase subunit NDUFA12 [Alphaproteobacteria bacterium GM202ARS2]